MLSAALPPKYESMCHQLEERGSRAQSKERLDISASALVSYFLSICSRSQYRNQIACGWRKLLLASCASLGTGECFPKDFEQTYPGLTSDSIVLNATEDLELIPSSYGALS